MCTALLPAQGSPLHRAGGHHRSLLVLCALTRHPLSSSRSCAAQNRNTNQPEQAPGREQRGSGNPWAAGQGVQPKKPQLLDLNPEALILLLRFPASSPSQGRAAGILPLLCVEKRPHGDV